MPPVTIGLCRGLWRDRPCQAGGRRGRRQVRMAPTPGAANVLQWRVQSAAGPRGPANRESPPQFGLQPATRLHEAGIASKGASATAP